MTDEGPTAAAPAKGETTVVELSRSQRMLARRVAESRAVVPDVTLVVEADMTAALALRAEHDVPHEALLVRACALALREHPRVNGSYRDGRLELHERINVGVVIATDETLIVPAIADADAVGLVEAGRRIRSLADRARGGEITRPELGAVTFTVANLGATGVRRFSPVVQPPQAAVLALGAVAERATVRDGRVEPAPTADLTLVVDERILHGTHGARFLARVRELLEAPEPLV